MTSLLASRVGAGDDWLGLHLAGSTLGQWTYTYTGIGYTADSAHVRLTVTYESAVPEPATLAMAAPALAAGLGAFVRRRRLATRRAA